MCYHACMPKACGITVSEGFWHEDRGWWDSEADRERSEMAQPVSRPMRGRSKEVIGAAEGLQYRNWEERSGDSARRMNLGCGVAGAVSVVGIKGQAEVPNTRRIQNETS